MESSRLPPSFEEAIITELPGTAYYIPDFISESEADFLLSKIQNAPLPVWKQLSHRRLQAYPSVLSPQNALLASTLPPWLVHPIIDRLSQLPMKPSQGIPKHLFEHSPHGAPNHVLVNEYEPGQGIFPHEDGAAYYPIVATVSLGSHIVLDIHKKKDDGSGEREEKARWRILQEPRSLLVTTGELYSATLHGIAEVDVDKDLHGGPHGVCNWDLLGDRRYIEDAGGRVRRTTRISLTYRDVLKVKQLGRALSHLPR